MIFFTLIKNNNTMKQKLKLSNVTLLGVATPKDINQAQESLKISSQNIEFGTIKLLTSSIPKKKYSEIEYVPIPLMDFFGYNRLIIEDLHKYFETSHCLIIQADSFVVNAHCWNKEFLKFDYIGAPWTNKINPKPNLILNLKENTVGNGGFSLRSRKLVETTSKINFKSLNLPVESEDVIICYYLYKKMIDSEIKFAPPKIAAQFSMEDQKTNNSYGYDVSSVFGFHGKHLMNFFKKRYLLNTI